MKNSNKNDCMYCNDECSEPHFACGVCGRGMCDSCYDSEVEHDKHYQLESCEHDYICEECAKRDENHLIEIEIFFEDESNKEWVTAAIGQWDGVSNDDHIFYWFDNIEQVIGKHGDFTVVSVKGDDSDGSSKESDEDNKYLKAYELLFDEAEGFGVAYGKYNIDYMEFDEYHNKQWFPTDVARSEFIVKNLNGYELCE